MDREVGGTVWAKRLLVGTLLAVTGTAPVAAQCGYEISAIIQPPACPPPLNEPPATIPTSMNELGQVVGYHHRCLAAGTVPFFWSPETGLVDLPIPAGFDEGYAWDMNGAGDIVGSLRMNNRYHAILWRDGEVIDLGWMPGGNFSVASAVNDSGVIVGWWGNTTTGDPSRAAFRWVDGVMSTIELPMGRNGAAVDVNEAGAIAGWMGQAPHIDAHAYVCADGEVTDLGVIPEGFAAMASAINELGEVVGSGRTPQEGYVFGVSRAFLWDGQQMIPLGTLTDHLHSAVIDIASDGRAVGRSWNVAGNPNVSHAFVWQDGPIVNLNDLISDRSELTVIAGWAINDVGQIAAQAKTADNTVLGAILTPLEQPGDINGDCETDFADLIILLIAWGQTGSSADLNGDGIVNVLDLIILLLNFGS